MTEKEQLEKAIELAKKAHANQVDRGGNPYVEHLMAVASGSASLKEEAVAWLHDILEDTSVDEAYLRSEGFDDEIIEAVKLLTKCYGEHFSYEQYLSAIYANPFACAVKKRDLAHNMDISRLGKMTIKDVIYQEKYQVSLAYLEGRLEKDFVFPEIWSRHIEG